MNIGTFRTNLIKLFKFIKQKVSPKRRFMSKYTRYKYKILQSTQRKVILVEKYFLTVSLESLLFNGTG